MVVYFEMVVVVDIESIETFEEAKPIDKKHLDDTSMVKKDTST